MKWSSKATRYAIKNVVALLVIKHEKSERMGAPAILVGSRFKATVAQWANTETWEEDLLATLRVNLRCTIKVYMRFFSKLHLDKMIQSVHIGIALAIFGLSITLAQIRPGQLDHFLPPPPSRFNVNEGQRQRRPPLTTGTDLLSR